jgi:hypothetical protein
VPAVIKALAAAAGVVAAFPLLVIVLATGSSASNPDRPADTQAVSARADIPVGYLTWYIDAAQTCSGLPWPVLAGIGKVESDHGRSDLPGVHAGANFAGAEGPMQFLPGTFGEFAVDADPGQPLSPYDPAEVMSRASAYAAQDGGGPAVSTPLPSPKETSS